MRSLKAIDEDLAAAGDEAKRLMQSAKRQGRELDKNEGRIVDGLIAKIRDLNFEKLQADHAQRQILALSCNGRRPIWNQSTMSTNSSSGYSPSNLTLPLNGVLPNDGQRYQPFSRMATLKAFKSDRDAYASGMWLKAVVERLVNQRVNQRAEDYCSSVGLEIQNTAVEGSGILGGYTVPAPVSNAIIEVREKVGVARKVCNVMPTNADTLTVPKKTGGLVVYIVPEAGTITTSDKSWGAVALTVQGRKVLSLISQELSEDSLINMTDNIISEQGYALALAEDDELIKWRGRQRPRRDSRFAEFHRCRRRFNGGGQHHLGGAHDGRSNGSGRFAARPLFCLRTKLYLFAQFLQPMSAKIGVRGRRRDGFRSVRRRTKRA